MSENYTSVLVTSRINLANVYINGLPIIENKQGVLKIQTPRKDWENMIRQFSEAQEALTDALVLLDDLDSKKP
jgi:hypothetical protein